MSHCSVCSFSYLLQQHPCICACDGCDGSSGVSESEEGMSEQKLREVLEVADKALDGFKYLDDGNPKEMDLVQYAKLVRTIYENGENASQKVKEALAEWRKP